MRIIKLPLLAAIMLTTGITAVKAQTADEILEKHVTAMGGTEKWDNIKTIKKTGSLSVQGMDIAVTESIITGKGLRVDFTVMGMSGFQIMTSTAGYVMNPGQPKVDTLKPEMLKGVNEQLDEKIMYCLDCKNYKTIGTKTELIGKDSVDNSLCYKIKITDKDGNESTSYFDANTYYLLRTERKIKKDEQEQEVATTFKDYKKFADGIFMPMTVGSPMGEIIFKTVDINQPVDEHIFIPTPPATK